MKPELLICYASWNSSAPLPVVGAEYLRHRNLGLASTPDFSAEATGRGSGTLIDWEPVDSPTLPKEKTIRLRQWVPVLRQCSPLDVVMGIDPGIWGDERFNNTIGELSMVLRVTPPQRRSYIVSASYDLYDRGRRPDAHAQFCRFRTGRLDQLQTATGKRMYQTVSPMKQEGREADYSEPIALDRGRWSMIRDNLSPTLSTIVFVGASGDEARKIVDDMLREFVGFLGRAA